MGHLRPTIAMVSDAIHPYHHGGKELRYHELSHRLAQRADVHVYTMKWWPGGPTHIDGNVTYHAISSLRPLYSKDRRSISQAVVFAASCFRLFRHRFDILEADHIPYFQIFVLRLVTTLKRKRFVVTWHEVWGKSYWNQYLGKLGIIAWGIEYLAMRLPDHIIAASPQTTARLQSILKNRGSITTAPNGVDLETVRTVIPSSESTDLVVVGRLIAHKRVDMLLDALALLHAEGIRVSCRIIGDGPERNALRKHASTLGISSAVDFRCEVHEQKDVYAYMKASKVFVFPSCREGFGIAVLEAIACGLPVVTTSAPDNLAQHIVARSANGIVCDPTAVAICEAVKDALTKDGSIQGEYIDPWVAEYAWDAVVRRVADAFLI